MLGIFSTFSTHVWPDVRQKTTEDQVWGQKRQTRSTSSSPVNVTRNVLLRPLRTGTSDKKNCIFIFTSKKEHTNHSLDLCQHVEYQTLHKTSHYHSKPTYDLNFRSWLILLELQIPRIFEGLNFKVNLLHNEKPHFIPTFSTSISYKNVRDFFFRCTNYGHNKWVI